MLKNLAHRRNQPSNRRWFSTSGLYCAILLGVCAHVNDARGGVILSGPEFQACIGAGGPSDPSPHPNKSSPDELRSFSKTAHQGADGMGSSGISLSTGSSPVALASSAAELPVPTLVSRLVIQWHLLLPPPPPFGLLRPPCIES